MYNVYKLQKSSEKLQLLVTFQMPLSCYHFHQRDISNLNISGDQFNELSEASRDTTTHYFST